MKTNSKVKSRTLTLNPVMRWTSWSQVAKSFQSLLWKMRLRLRSNRARMISPLIVNGASLNCSKASQTCFRTKKRLASYLLRSGSCFRTKSKVSRSLRPFRLRGRPLPYKLTTQGLWWCPILLTTRPWWWSGQWRSGVWRTGGRQSDASVPTCSTFVKTNTQWWWMSRICPSVKWCKKWLNSGVICPIKRSQSTTAWPMMTKSAIRKKWRSGMPTSSKTQVSTPTQKSP